MSFGFQFDDSEMDEEYLSSSNAPFQPSTSPTTQQTSTSDQAPFCEHSLEDMLEHLPSRISYSSIDISLSSGSGSSQPYKLLRRDLFDARFQMLLDEDDHSNSQVDTHSDLIPNVYEGGLKTWECALDLVEVLHTHSTTDHKHILELGCGTALPSLFLFSNLLASSNRAGVTLHLADYNAQVLQLVTLPNLLLTWYASPAGSHYRSLEASHRSHEQQELSRRGQEHFATDEAELAITDELLAAFSESLASRGIQVKIYSGAWSGFPQSLVAGKMDLILTSETIYSLESLPALVELLGRYAGGQVLVAAKVIYFGVGGGVESFKQVLAQLHPTARVEPVHSVTKGVGRTVLSVTF
ncbi:hypothetical protein PSEUBRA_005535 [Kalmanozyma brasiliensis GHG001]|uniref:protein-histidine N-methyltransferase n=1 Tax=Kalmanozyma brasiliensis (strain GHG001) TaxID=1365824 RepID=V5GGY1_KALBG|nr:uncharacterized protein PSEUBRA_005535 [Kalmanozyma brasiliensis GHG001]EST05267.1 hypothetical protein PSEUBRA_005535 [Kalmanozyma brasiliensis GHG001]